MAVIGRQAGQVEIVSLVNRRSGGIKVNTKQKDREMPQGKIEDGLERDVGTIQPVYDYTTS